MTFLKCPFLSKHLRQHLRAPTCGWLIPLLYLVYQRARIHARDSRRVSTSPNTSVNTNQAENEVEANDAEYDRSSDEGSGRHQSVKSTSNPRGDRKFRPFYAWSSIALWTSDTFHLSVFKLKESSTMIMNDNSLLIRFTLYIKVGLFTMVINFGIKETRRQMNNSILTV